MRTSLVVLGILGLFVRPNLSQTFAQQEQTCSLPNRSIGSCVPLPSCPSLVNIYARNPSNPQVVQYIRLVHRNCGTRNAGRDPVVCCSDQVPSRTTRMPATAPPPTTEITPTSTTTTGAPSNQGSSCRGPDLAVGVCTDIRKCKPLLDRLVSNSNDASFKQFLRLSNEICKRTLKDVVCCPSMSNDIDEVRLLPGVTDNIDTNPVTPSPTEDVTRLPTPRDGCGFTNGTFRKIVGGYPSKLGAWPWIALIGYDETLSGNSPFKCGGTLITTKHVLTAAHCIKSTLSFVRLGEHDLTRDDESPHVDINVIKYARHPKYNRANGHSDIAILYLERNVPLNDFIGVACLPTTAELRSKSYTSYTPFVAGWGKTLEGGTSANVLQELQITIHDNQECVNRYSELRKLFSEDQFDRAVICAGVQTGGKDTCQGDSGGPLMIPELYEGKYRFYIVGVVSYGIGCGRPNIPSAYTSTQYFMEWIEEKVAEIP